MHSVEEGKRTTKTGYQYDITIYQAGNCSTCPLRGACHKQKGNRRIEINKKLIKHKQIARQNLTSKRGKKLRGRRNSEVEQTFGQLKSNKKFNRFLLKGLPKISIELFLLAIAHNIHKLAKYMSANDLIFNCNLFFMLNKPFVKNILAIAKKYISGRTKKQITIILLPCFDQMKKAA